MKKTIQILFLLHIVAFMPTYAQQAFYKNSFILSNEKPDTNKTIDLGNIRWASNEFPLLSFNDSASAHFLQDTIYTFNKLLVNTNYVLADSEYLEIWWRVKVDSSMAKKAIGLEFSNAAYTKIFWDNKIIIDLGRVNFDTKTFVSNKIRGNVYAINTGNAGWHNLVIRQKFNDYKKGSEDDILPFVDYKIHRDINEFIKTHIEKDFSFEEIVEKKGFRFYLLSIFIVSVLFYLIVQKTKAFLWFSVFSFTTILFYFQNDLTNNRSFGFEIIIMLFILECFSFLAFVFYSLSSKIPKRVFWYIVVFAVVMFYQIYVQSFLYEYFPMMKHYSLIHRSPVYLIIGLLVIISIECIVKVIYAVWTKQKGLTIIAIGIGQLAILIPLAFLIDDPIGSYLGTFSIYAFPTSLLISLIYMVKDSFTENINKQQKVLELTQANEKILEEQNIVLEEQVKERTFELVKEKEVVEEKNRQITDSIEYALRIQTAILPPGRLVKQYLSDSFIYYQPKDIVAGDFYWMDTVNDLVLFAACDCTGHGVPGAMVSVVCHNALNRAVREFGLTQPAAILDKTAQLVIENFEGSDTEIKDGMDISMCALNPQTRKLEWAGANNPLWLIQNKELIETKADKQSIGKGDDIKPFTNHEFDLSQGQSIYIFSDGFADQFGGEPERKITKRRFKELIVSLQNIPMHEQGKALEKYIADFKGSIHQTDDILVIGVRV